MHRVDYDRVAPLYDEPARDHVADPNLISFLETRDRPATSTIRILDVGCGTGKQLAANHRAFPDMAMVGVDRFQGMLRIARSRCPGVAWLQADGASLPLSSGTFDYVTSQFAYPHVRRTEQLVRETFRALRPGGRFVMTNIDPWSMPGWLIYRYFPEAFDLDRQDFVEVDRFVATMRNAGFQDIEARRDDLSKAERLAEFLSFARDRHRASQLLAIPDEAYAGGIRRLEEALDAARDEDLVVRSEFTLVTIAGTSLGELRRPPR